MHTEEAETGAPMPARPRFDGPRLERAFAVVERHVREGQLPAAVLAIAGPDGPAQIVA